jgi:membrane protein
MLIWYVGSFVIRWIISASVGGASIYGPLAAPIVLMIWLYVLAIAMLIGAALNAAIEKRWPCREILEAKEGSDQPIDPDSLIPNRTPGENPLAPAGEQR